jgi:hypothetical protein
MATLPKVTGDAGDDAALLPPPNYPKLKLTASAINSLLGRGFTQADIARYFAITRQAVNDFIRKHPADIIPVDDYDHRMTSMLKVKSLQAVEGLDDATFKKAGLVGINMFMGTAIDKIRLIQGQSSINLSVLGQIVSKGIASFDINNIPDVDDVSGVTEASPSSSPSSPSGVTEASSAGAVSDTEDNNGA